MKKRRVLLLGSYGQSNLGDDLLMWNYLELLKERGFSEIYVNANTTELIPEPIKTMYPKLHIVTTYDTSVLSYLRLIRHVDCIVYGGGTLYKELYASTGRSRYAVIIRMMGFNLLARWTGTKLYHLNIGIGSLKTWFGRFVSRVALGAATHTVFRDQKSYNIAKDTLRLPLRRISVAPDGLFLNRIWERTWNKAAAMPKPKSGRVVGINVLSDIPDWINREHYIATMRQFVTRLLKTGNSVVFVPFQHAFNPHSDYEFTKGHFGDLIKQHDNCTLLESVPIDQISDTLRRCDVFVGMRFHSLLLATANRVPFVALAYDTKCWRFIEENEYPHALRLEDLAEDALTEHYENAVVTRKQTAEQLDVITRRTYAEMKEALRTLQL